LFNLKKKSNLLDPNQKNEFKNKTDFILDSDSMNDEIKNKIFEKSIDLK
jgi:hypothetical protein